MTEDEIDLLANKLADKLEQRQSEAVSNYLDLLWNSPPKTGGEYIQEMRARGIVTIGQALKEIKEILEEI